MNEIKFWEIIALLDWTKSEDADIVLPAIEALATLSIEEIYAFYEIFCKKIYLLDTQIHAENAYENGLKSLHTDGFFEIRCAVIANGKTCYEKAITDPTKMPQELYFAEIFSIPYKAYKKKTGEKFKYKSKYSVVTQSNLEGWGKKFADSL